MLCIIFIYLILSICLIECVYGDHGGQKKVLNTLQFQFLLVLSCHVDAGIQSQVLCSNYKRFLPLGHFSIPKIFFFLI